MNAATQTMEPAARKAAYRLLGELLVYPEERDRARVDALANEVATAPPEVREPLLRLMRSPAADDCEGFLTTLELQPLCPLYLGTYLFDEPDNCRGAATSGRNAYMIELAGVYSHFGLSLDGVELPDYLPAVVEFLALSLDRPDRNRGELRERLIERLLQPALPELRKRFDEKGGAWADAILALEALISTETPATVPPPPLPRSPSSEVRR